MGFQVGSSCYGTAEAAVSAAVSANLGAVHSRGAELYVIDVASVTASSVTYSFTPVGGGSAITEVLPVTPQPCQMLDYADGLELGWMVGGVWVLVAAVLFLRRGLVTSHDAPEFET